MKPLNQPERRTRLWQFSLLYLLALLIPLGASYYLFSNNSIADENARLKKELDRTHEEQGRLIAQFDTLTRHLQRIDKVDLQMIAEPNPNVRSVLLLKNQDYSNAIAARLSELRNDTALMQIPAHRLLARNILRDFDFYRSTRNTVDGLRQEVAKSGEGARGSAMLATELSSCKLEASAAKQQVVTLQAALAAASARGGGGGGGGAPAPATPSSSSKLQIELLRDQVAFAEADCLRQRALDHKAHSKERKQMLEQSRTAFIQILQNPATENLKASIEKTLEPINVELGRPARFFGLF
ncbi:hypothetical protein GCM10022409_08030 [Hymenobacter glaciei]|uniref:Uncharacterized protein n=1 Tax=Hymenobacter glaciei TaxID=877209 RepID=A0ABP7THI4_9BACT